MPDQPLPGIDHPVILLRDLVAAREFYARLGFTLTPIGHHPWGTTTSLAVMQRSALELLGTEAGDIDAMALDGFAFGRHMHDALAEREGLSLVALHSRDARGDTAAMTARGIASQGIIEFRRKVKPPGGDWDEAVVSLGMLYDPALPRASQFLAQQHKPHLLWVPAWMQHANGARFVAGVTYVAEDPAPVLARLRAMFGGPPDADVVATGQGAFRVLRPTDWAASFGTLPMPLLDPGVPAGAAIDVAVPDTGAVARLLAAADIAFVATRAGPAVAAPGNVVIRFVAA